jgi:hypothetical protein
MRRAGAPLWAFWLAVAVLLVTWGWAMGRSWLYRLALRTLRPIESWLHLRLIDATYLPAVGRAIEWPARQRERVCLWVAVLRRAEANAGGVAKMAAVVRRARS